MPAGPFLGHSYCITGVLGDMIVDSPAEKFPTEVGVEQSQQAGLTVTEALAKGSFLIAGVPALNMSTARIVPYAELYQARTAVMETPVEHLQQAAEDEKHREQTAEELEAQ